ncbi:MAG TPA: hypothetical protein VE360_05900 [Pyrinomonadaceae bacterium]|nr:hypothetical protein [Pyrinomonadaceae bacterium]
MLMRARLSQVVICVVALFGGTAVAQNVERRQTNPPPQAQEQTPNANPVDAVSNEIGLLRKSLQTLNTRLREISDKLFAPDAKQGGPSDKTEDRISRNLDLLSRTEQRAEVLRKLLIELIEKETSFKTRLMQVEEDLRPDSIDRAISLVGSTRTPELRDVRRRVLENERRGVESLLNQTSQSRLRLEEDVKQADALVHRLRQRLLPLIEKEIDKINPEQ